METKEATKLEEVKISPSQEILKEVPLKPIDPIFINTPTGAAAIFGHEYISKKMLQVIGIVLSHDAFEITYHGVKSIIFRTDGYPKEGDKQICANFAPDVCGISINMEKTLEKAIERSLDHPATSLMTSWWIEMLLNFGHELHHAVRWDSERDKLSDNKEAQAKEETLAENYSNELITALVQQYDIEPPQIAEEIWFNSQIMELLSGKENDRWAKDQQDMLNHGYLWKHVPADGTEETILLQSFKDVICLIMDGDETSEEWNKETTSLPDGVKTLDEQLNGKKITTISSHHDKPDDPVVPTQNPTIPVQQTYYQDDDDRDYNDFTDPIAPTQQPVQQPQPQPVFTANTGLQHDAATVSKIAKQVYMKMYNFIFTNCGPIPNSDLGFSKPEAVCLTPIPLTDEERLIFVSMNHLDVNGRWCTDVPTTNGLFGKVMKNTKLPSYEVFLNVNGVTHKRLFIPQNPMKRNSAGQLTQRASEARAGSAIAYVIIPSDGTKTEYGPSIVNGEYKVPLR